MRNTILSAAGALILDEAGRVLLVEPNYKDHWEIPGGVIEVGETPSQGCAREVAEELGLTREPGRLLVVDWAPHPTGGDRVLFVFDGGTITQADIEAIRLQPEELDSYEFLSPAEALERLIPRLRRRVDAALLARAENRTLYLEHGVPH
ncbi:NUDIX domain-containing protein [Actinophytocola oryzae]|uniref:ADP-ribose pyrophosphatase YjhB (NUDIX family) n=1 Tax=Actinophytocola oryzae TaxID=502181 RepID=A0A4R7UU30_9PSEU|nr:NUDIX hydrolase [Actinophytocola oryzae]TDV38662.1 ADP-ribose pyrophosphatase YjhB (NUDIX family) [Actinophytocola oryzae]